MGPRAAFALVALLSAAAAPPVVVAPPPYAFLSISVEADGTAALNLQVTPPPPKAQADRLAASLHCDHPVPCTRKLGRRGAHVEGTLDVTELTAELAAMGVTDLNVWVSLPNRGPVAITTTGNLQSEHFAGPWVLAYLSPTFQRQITFTTRDPAPHLLGVAFGSTRSPWLLLLAILAPLAAIPLAAAIAARRADPFGWPSRLVPVAVHLGGLAWMVYASALHADEVAALLLGRTSSAINVEGLAATLLPAFLAVLLASAAATRGLAHALAIDVPVRPLGLVTLLAFPLLVLAMAALLLSPHGADWAATARLASALALGAFLLLLAQSGGIDVRMYLVKEGPLRDQVDDLAQGCRSRAGKVYAVPEELAAAARAMAGRRGLVVSDDLAQALTQQELDAALATELCRLAPRAGWRAAGFWLVSLPLLTCFPPLFLLTGSVAGDFAARVWIVGGVYLLLSRWGRRYADAEAARAVGSAEAVGVALFKMARRGRLCPHRLRAEEVLFPLHAALRRAATLARDDGAELAHWIEASGRDAAPADVAEWARTLRDEHLFGKEYRARTVARVSWRVLGTCLLGPLLAAHVLLAIAPAGPTLVLGSLGAIAASIALPHLTQPRRIPGMNSRRDQLASRLRAEGFAIEGARFVGLAPGPAVRVHDGFYDWDFGFLLLHGPTLAFLGDRHRFALPRGEVASVALGAGPPSYQRFPRVHVAPRTHRPFHLRPIVHGKHRREAAALARALSSWRDGGSAEPVVSPALAALPAPDHAALAGTPPRQQVRLGTMIPAVVFMTILGVVLGLLTGLPLDPVRAGSALHVPIGATLAFLALLPPTLLHRDGDARGEFGH